MTELSPHVANGTRVTFPAGAVSGASCVLASGPWGLIVDQTPFHPFNARWPDQPSDTGSIIVAGRPVSVVDCQVGAVEFGSGRLVIGPDLPVSHGAEGWHWVVVHVLDRDVDVPVGSEVSLWVEAGRRHELSAVHTARHLSGLALNTMLASLWSQGMPADSLGNPNFDELAMSSSAVTTHGFRDTYRIRTLSAQGGGALDAEHLDSLVTILGMAVTDRIHRWLARRAPIRLVAAGPYLADPRAWECDLAQGTARVVCDGTHTADLGVIAGIEVTAALTESRTELALTGSVTAAAPGTRRRTGPYRAARHIHTGLMAIRH